MNTHLAHGIRLVAGFVLLAMGVMSIAGPELVGIPLLLAGMALVACGHPAVDRFVVRLETWRHACLHPYRIRKP